MTTEKEFDSILLMLENPVRRRIIKRLSQGSCYPLQLAKELGLGQQLVAKHLKALEDSGLVVSSLEPSPRGPRRRAYSTKKSLSLTLNVGPNLFSTRLLGFEALPDKQEITNQSSMLRRRINEISSSSNRSRRVVPLSGLLKDLDERLHGLESEMAMLLYLRNLAMKEASSVVDESNLTLDFRRVFFQILEEHSKDVKVISEALNLRESTIREILSQLEKLYSI